MKSYAVAKAYQFANNEKTKPLIFKSVMDNPCKKSDIHQGIDWKKFAAFTSAPFRSRLFKENVIY